MFKNLAKMKTYTATFSNDTIQENATFTSENLKKAKEAAQRYKRHNFKERVRVSVKLKK